MQINNMKSWKTALLLSIIIPVSLLTTFKLTGIIKEPTTIIETKELPPKEWSFPRPSGYFTICQLINASYVNSPLSFLTIFAVIEYDQGLMNWVPPGGSLRFSIFINASISTGYLQSIEMVFCNDTQPSHIWILETSISLRNLTLTSFKWASDAKAFNKHTIILTGTNKPREASFQAIGEWFLLDSLPSAKTHQLEILCILIYYDGSAYKELIQPFRLKFYTGYHILTFNDAIIEGETSVSINVSVDGVAYQTPATIFVAEGAHQIGFPPQLEYNSTKYDFDVGLINKSPNILKSNISIDVRGDMNFDALYRRSATYP